MLRVALSSTRSLVFTLLLSIPALGTASAQAAPSEPPVNTPAAETAVSVVTFGAESPTTLSAPAPPAATPPTPPAPSTVVLGGPPTKTVVAGVHIRLTGIVHAMTLVTQGVQSFDNATAVAPTSALNPAIFATPDLANLSF